MSMLAPANPLPLGMQISAVNQFVTLCKRCGEQPLLPNPVELSCLWEDAKKGGLASYGRTLPDIAVINGYPEKIPEFLAEVRATSRDIFDPQIAALAGQRLTHHVVTEQRLLGFYFRWARELDVISKDPAEAIERSLRVYDRTNAVQVTGALLSGVSFACGVLVLLMSSDATFGVVTRVDHFLLGGFLGTGLITGIASIVARHKISPMYKEPRKLEL